MVAPSVGDDAEADRLASALRQRVLDDVRSRGEQPVAWNARVTSSTAKVADGEPAARPVACPTPALINLLQEWDLGANGVVSLAELFQALLLLGIEGSASAVQLLYDRIDSDDSFHLTYDELAAWFVAEEPEAAAS